MRLLRVAPFFVPAVILLVESATLGQPDTNLGLGLGLTIVFGLAFAAVVSALSRRRPAKLASS